MRLAIAAMVLLLAGCAPMVWLKAGGTAQEFQRDQFECQQEAIRTSNAMGLQSAIGMAIQQRSTVKECLVARGYTQQR